MKVVAIIPALNEEEAIGAVVTDAVVSGAAVIVVDNGSTDATAAVAEAAGARVVRQPERGYGAACMAGVEAEPAADVYVFLDGDGSDPPLRIPNLLALLRERAAGLVLGVRRGEVEPGSMLWHQRLGNRFMSGLISLLSGRRIHDLPSYKAIDGPLLRSLGLKERKHGWTAELIMACACIGVPIVEIETGYRRRVGESKVSGSLKGSLLAGYRLNAAIVRVWLQRRNARGLKASETAA